MYVCSVDLFVPEDRILCVEEDPNFKRHHCEILMDLLKKGKTHKDCPYRVLFDEKEHKRLTVQRNYIRNHLEKVSMKTLNAITALIRKEVETTDESA